MTATRKTILVGIILFFLITAGANFLAVTNSTVADIDIAGVPLIPALDTILIVGVLIVAMWLAPKVMLFAAISVFVAAAGVMLVLSVDWKHLPQAAIGLPALTAITSGIIASIVFGLAIFILYRVLRWILRLLSSALGVYALRPLSILVSLALAAMIFRTGALDIWFLFYNFATVIFVDLPRALVDVIASSYSCGALDLSTGSIYQGAFSDCIFRVGVKLANGPRLFFEDLVQNLRSVIDVIKFFATWSVLLWILDDFIVHRDNSDPRSFRVMIGSLTAQTKKHLGLAAIVALAAYLCLCAIIAVSVFKPAEKSQVLGDEAFKTRLDEGKLANSDDKASAFSARFPKTLDAFPESATTDSQYAKRYQIFVGEYSELQNSWSNLRSHVLNQQDHLAQRALASYRLENLNRVGSREQINHSLALENWYYDFLTQMFAQLDQCHVAILTFSSQAKGALGAVESAMAPKATSGIGDFSTFGLTTYEKAIDAGSRARQTCELRSISIESQPHRNEFGYSLGILGTIAIWLLSTEFDTARAYNRARGFWFIRRTCVNACEDTFRTPNRVGALECRRTGRLCSNRCISRRIRRNRGRVAGKRRSKPEPLCGVRHMPRGCSI